MGVFKYICALMCECVYMLVSVRVQWHDTGGLRATVFGSTGCRRGAAPRGRGAHALFIVVMETPTVAVCVYW